MAYEIVANWLYEVFGVSCEDRVPSVIMFDAGAMIVTLDRAVGILRLDIPLYPTEAMNADEPLFKSIARLNGSGTAQHQRVFYALTPANVLHLSSVLNYRTLAGFDAIADRMASMLGNFPLLKQFIVDYVEQSRGNTASHGRQRDPLWPFIFA
ncbi:hypothetical protein [Paludibacterium purpuratum]|uniref:Tir chaperone family protein CesT n=1 Tax=Paludibacterium purpuratum TaxID=1144873 RepID=A0A4R7B165_9NEIS|nr:hypothetical protein [Paludibacterium purpuratum]TDR76649.1 hypothetical protein DFP86_11075 [Paludibacterium purpuratum]